MSTIHTAAQAFAKNRAEELGFDLWGEFIIPPYFDKLSLDDVRKPMIFEGGRGCGKTTLLRYLSYATQLSPKRELTQETLPKQIGLYLRADTWHLRTFRGEALLPDEWARAFEHDLCLLIATELLGALMLLGRGAARQRAFPGIAALDLSAWQDFDASAPSDLVGLIRHVRSSRNKLSTWLNNQESETRPKFLPMRQALTTLIDAIQSQLMYLEDSVFFVFIDEYENLLEYQMKVINTHLKHSEAPLIFHIATKRNGMATRSTVSSEQLQKTHDFRPFDIEAHSEAGFKLFAAELFCSRLRKKGFTIGPQEIGDDLLFSVEKLEFRRNDEDYKRNTIDAVSHVLPELGWKAAARYVLADKTLSGRVRDSIRDALKLSDASMDANDFIKLDASIETLCVSALLHQGKKPRQVLDELEKAVTGLPSQFASADWAHSYFPGSMYLLFLPLQRPCVLYAGFESFLKLSKGNTRHFLELCHLSLLQATVSGDGELQPVDVKDQADAARSASALFVKETSGCGDHGNRLFHLVNALGQIFRLSHARPSQSEAERTHFAISSGEISMGSQALLTECLKWSVLFGTAETKVKDSRLEAMEYVFNPIFAPYFGISYNKGRKLEIPAASVDVLLAGSRDEMNKLVKSYQKKWKLSGDTDQISLFEG